MIAVDSLSLTIAAIRENPRLRIGIFVIFGILWFYGLLVLGEEVTLAGREHQTMARKLARLNAQATQTEWAARAGPTLAIQLDLESRLWREGTIGLAQAAFQDWLNQAMSQSGVTRTAAIVAAQEDSAVEKSGANTTGADPTRDLWKVSAKASFDFTPKGLYTLLGRLEGYEKQITVESLIVRGSQVPRVEMVLVAYFQKPSTVAKDASNK